MFFAIFVAAENNPSNLFDALKKQIENNNEENQEEKDYLMFLDAEGNNIESSLMADGTEWLEENIEDLVPFRDELRSLLGEYNVKPCVNFNNEIVQHYVMVVDVAPALFTRVTGGNFENPQYLGMSPVNYFSMSVTEDDVTYNSILRDAKLEAISNFKSTFDKEKLTIVDQNANLYVSIFIVDRKIELNRIKELVFTYDDVFKEFSSGNFVEILNNDLKPEVDGLPKSGFSFLNQCVKKFIKVFHGATPNISTNCYDVESMGFESNLGEDFYSYYCDGGENEEFDIEQTFFKEIVYRCAKYLDFLHVYHSIATEENQAMIDHLGVNFLSEWDGMLREFVETYYASGMNQKFAIYFKNNYRALFNTYKNNPDYQLLGFDLKFIDIFFEVDDLRGVEHFSIILSDFLAMNSGEPTSYVNHHGELRPYYEWNHPGPAEKITNDLYEAVTQAYNTVASQLYTDEDRESIYYLILDNRELLWDFYLNPTASGFPGIGKKVTELAEAVGKFLQNYENYTVVVDSDDWKKSVPEDMPIVLTGLTRHFTSTTNGPKSNDDFDLVNTLTAELTTGKKLDFTIKVADKYVYEETCLAYNSDPICIKEGYAWKPVYSATQYDFSLKDNKSVDFFTPIANLKILAPSYYKNCMNCKQKITYEYAFVTASRIRDKAVDDVINNSMLAIEVVTLPFAFLEVVAAKGAWLVFRGLVLSVNLEAVALSVVGGGDFAAGCNKVFGPSLGPIVKPYLESLNNVVALVELSELVGQGGLALVKSFERDKLEHAAAAAMYSSKSKIYLGADINNFSQSQLDEVKTLRSQIETNLGVNEEIGMSKLIDDLEDEFIGFAAGGGSSPLRSNEKFEELMIKYQYWKKGFDDQTGLMQSTDFLSDLSPAEKNILDAMLSDELGDLIIDSFESFDVVKNSHKMKALKKLAKNNVCQL
ncbi:MAG: hypothetical protein ACJATI_004471 [Halioglobus sp.]|jgi:hypothetical protein